MKMWFRAKRRQFLELLGLRVTGQWTLLRAVNKLYGEEAAKACLVEAIMLELECGIRNKDANKIMEVSNDTKTL